MSRPQGYKTFFVLVLRLVLRTRNLCSIEYDTKKRGYKSFGVRSPLSPIWSILREPAVEIFSERGKKCTVSIVNNPGYLKNTCDEFLQQKCNTIQL